MAFMDGPSEQDGDQHGGHAGKSKGGDAAGSALDFKKGFRIIVRYFVPAAFEAADNDGRNGNNGHDRQADAVGQDPASVGGTQKAFCPRHVIEQTPEEQRAENDRDEDSDQIVPPLAEAPVASPVGVTSEQVHTPEPADDDTFEQAEKGDAPRPVDKVADHAEPVESAFGDIDDGDSSTDDAHNR